MKKLMIAASAALFAAVGFADVESSNIVGYNTIAAPVGFSIFPVQFKNVGGDTTVDLLKLLNGTYEPVTMSQALRGLGTQLWVMNSDGGYDTYYYLSDAYDEVADDDATGWANDAGDLIDSATASLGDSFWLVNGTTDANSFTCSGEVSGNAAETLTLSTGFQLASNPFPMDVAFESINWSSLTPVTMAQALSGLGTQLWVMNSEGGYDTYYYLSDAYDEVADDDATGWANDVGDLVSGKFANLGQGFWIVAPTDGTATFNK